MSTKFTIKKKSYHHEKKTNELFQLSRSWFLFSKKDLPLASNGKAFLSGSKYISWCYIFYIEETNTYSGTIWKTYEMALSKALEQLCSAPEDILTRSSHILLPGGKKDKQEDKKSICALSGYVEWNLSFQVRSGFISDGNLTQWSSRKNFWS